MAKKMKLPKVAKTWRQRLILLAHGVNLGLRGTGYQVRLRKSDCLVENEDGVFLYRARSLSAAVNWLHKQNIR
jgi:hypothetical protein